MNVPLFDVQAVHHGLQDDLTAAAQRVLAGGRFILGAETDAFEAEFAQYLGVQGCVGMGNGTDALEIALRALGLGPGSRVLMAANAGAYASCAARAIGATPIFADVEPNTLLVGPAQVEQALTSGPMHAVILTHLYGLMAEASEIAALCAAHGVPLIEDCAQAQGARRQGKAAGSFGQLACFSFYPTKNLGALGDGGAVVGNDRALLARVRALRQYGWADKYAVALTGGRNSRLDELQAAFLRVKLPWLDRHNAARRQIAARYRQAFAALPVQLQGRADAPLQEDHAMHLFAARVAPQQRAALRAHLQQEGVATDVHFPIADHLQSAYADAAASALPVTEAACASVLSLPCYPGMTDAQTDWVVDAVNRFFA